MKYLWREMHFRKREMPLLYSKRSQHEYLTKIICNSMLVLVEIIWLVTLVGWSVRMMDSLGLLVTTPILVLSFLLSFFTSRGYWSITRFFPILLLFILGIAGSIIDRVNTSYVLFYVISFIMAGLLIGRRAMLGCLIAALVLHLYFFRIIRQPSIEVYMSNVITSTSSFSIIGLILWISVNLQQRALDKGKEDSLAGVNNRSFFDAEIDRLDNGRQFPITIVYADINNLKQTNDLHGHAAGDHLLQRAAELLQSVTRNDDILCRLGGDEFAILCIKTDESVASQIEGRIHHKIEQHNIASDQSPIYIAVGTATTGTPGTLSETVRLADDRMYLNKAIQKNGKIK